MPPSRPSANIQSLLEAGSLRRFLERQRWFGDKARSIESVTLADALVVGERGGLALITVGFADGGAQEYLLPLAVVDAGDAEAVERQHPEAVIGPVGDAGTLIDGVFDDTFCIALLDIIQNGAELLSARGTWTPDRDDQNPQLPVDQIRRSAPDQSNTSIVFGDAAVLKLFRRAEAGPNPDVEICAFLTRQKFPYVPRTLGTLEYARRGESAAAIAMLQQFVPNRGNGWQVILHALTSLGEVANDRSSEARSLLEKLPLLLGRRTGELHACLGRSEDDAFVPEPFDGAGLALAANAMRTRAEAHLDLLSASLPRLDATTRTRAVQVLENRTALFDVFTTMAQIGDAGQRIRCHGDYHLGQTLVTDDDIVILDFEGEPARPLAERVMKSSPLRDTAGMLRSFSYVATAASRTGERQGATSAAGSFQAWASAAARLFLTTYVDALAGSSILPAARRDFEALLRAYIVDKALYEVGYELNNRPDWVVIPLRGVLQCLDDAAAASEKRQ